MNLPVDNLHQLYKSPAVNRISTFRRVTAEIRPADLALAYTQARESAPRRHDRGKRYFVDHPGWDHRSNQSNRKEEHLALALWDASRRGLHAHLPDGGVIELLDYQTPLKARLSDGGIGKVDLLGVINDRRVAIIELKVAANSMRTGDTPLRAYLEGMAYCAIVEANGAAIKEEINARYNRSIDVKPPSLVIMAPQQYWTGYAEHPHARGWWPALRDLATEISELLNLDTHFLGLRNVEFQMGTKSHAPKLKGRYSVLNVADLASD